MIITSVKLSAGGNEVFVTGDGGEKYRITAADASRGGLLKYAEHPELLPTQAHGEMLEFMSQKLSCISYAKYLLGFGDKSRKILKTKLKSKDYTDDVCEAALSVLESHGLIDDERLCSGKLVALARGKLYGPYRLKQELIKKGFSQGQIEIAFDEAELDFDEMLDKLVYKLTAKNKPSDKKALDALANKLIRYGYSYESIRDVLSGYDLI